MPNTRQIPRVSAATLAKEGVPVPGTLIDEQSGNALFQWRGDIYIVGRNGQVLGWEPGPRGLLDI